MENGFLTIKEASQYLGVKPPTLYSMVERKEIPHYRVGRLIKFTKSDLNAFMQDHRVERVDIEKVARKILNHRHNVDVDTLVKKTIAESRGNRYTAPHGRLESVKGVRKEVPNGAF